MPSSVVSDETREKNRQRSKQWRIDNRDRTREYWRNWREENIDRVREHGRRGQAKVRVKRRSAPGRATREQVEARVAYFGGRCWMCGAPWEEIDHVIPLSNGGSDWPANQRPACKTCNRRKWGHRLPVRELHKFKRIGGSQQ